MSFGAWLSGFAAGESTFSVEATRRATGGWRFGCRFLIGLRDDDLPILQEIQRFWGCGRIKHVKANRGSKPVAHYIVESMRDNVSTVVPHFIVHPLRAKKAVDFGIYREAVALMHDVSKRQPGEGATPWSRWLPSDEALFLELKKRISESRRYA